MAEAMDKDGVGTADVAVIIVNYRTPDLAVAALRSALAEAGDGLSVAAVLVDGGSADGSAERLAGMLGADEFAGRVTFLPLVDNLGFGTANNRAIQALVAEDRLPPLLLLLNPDARLLPGSLRRLIERMAREPKAGAVGALLVHEDGRPQGSVFPFPSLATEFAHNSGTGLIERLVGAPPTVLRGDAAFRADWVTGAAVLLRSDALREVGLFDEGFFLYFEETELMHRMTRAGWEMWHEPAARVVHHGGSATALRDPDTGNMRALRVPGYWYESRARYFMRTGGRGLAISASLAAAAGQLVWRARHLLSAGRSGGSQRVVRDMLGHLPATLRIEKVGEVPQII